MLLYYASVYIQYICEKSLYYPNLKLQNHKSSKMLIDTHAHLDMKDFSKDLEDVLDRALENGLTHIISIGVDLESFIEKGQTRLHEIPLPDTALP